MVPAMATMIVPLLSLAIASTTHARPGDPVGPGESWKYFITPSFRFENLSTACIAMRYRLYTIDTLYLVYKWARKGRPAVNL